MEETANPKFSPEDLPVERIVDLFVDMPCEFAEEHFREEIEAYEREISARQKPSDRHSTRMDGCQIDRGTSR
jgi:hypothetical protein